MSSGEDDSSDDQSDDGFSRNKKLRIASNLVHMLDAALRVYDADVAKQAKQTASNQTRPGGSNTESTRRKDKRKHHNHPLRGQWIQVRDFLKKWPPQVLQFVHEIHHTKLSKVWVFHGTSTPTKSHSKGKREWYEVTYFVTPTTAPLWRPVFAPSKDTVVTKVHALTMKKRPDLEYMLRNRVCPMPTCNRPVPHQGGPLCAVHTASRYHVRVGKSKISGSGLFATEPFLPNDRLHRTLPYGGEIITNELFALRYPDGTEPTYVVDVKNTNGTSVLFRVDGEYQRDLGTLVNSNAGTTLENNANLQDANIEALVHAMGQTKPQGSVGGDPPALWEEVCPVDVRVFGNVDQHGELLASYGQEYDDALKQNNKTLEDQITPATTLDGAP